MVLRLKLKVGEAKKITFTVTDSDGVVINLTGATCTFAMKRNKTDAVAVVTKNDVNFDKTDGANGIVSVVLTASDTTRAVGEYIGELKVAIDANNIDKSDDIHITIESSITV